jgi:hypothetical protein
LPPRRYVEFLVSGQYTMRDSTGGRQPWGTSNRYELGYNTVTGYSNQWCGYSTGNPLLECVGGSSIPRPTGVQANLEVQTKQNEAYAVFSEIRYLDNATNVWKTPTLNMQQMSPNWPYRTMGVWNNTNNASFSVRGPWGKIYNTPVMKFTNSSCQSC